MSSSSVQSGAAPWRSGRFSSRQRSACSAQRSGSVRERPDARANVGASLRVVGRAREQRVRETARARSTFAAWKVVDVDSEPPRIAADLVQREQADVPVEGGVLDALGRHRPVVCWNRVTNSPGASCSSMRIRRIGSGRSRHRRSVAVVDDARLGLDVRAIDAEAPRAPAPGRERRATGEDARPRAGTSSAPARAWPGGRPPRTSAAHRPAP